MKLRCVIIDDEPVARKILQEYIAEIGYLELVGQSEHPLKALPLFETGNIDLAFLDINMPKMNGIDFIKGARLPAKIIITTAYPEYAAEAYGLDVLDYLVKPISFERFLKACGKAKEACIPQKELSLSTDKKPDHFFIKCGSQVERIFYDELIYAEAMLNYVMLYTNTKKMMVYVTIKSLEDQLPQDIFIKVHKSFIINRTKVKSIEGNILDVGIGKITISQNLREKVFNEIVNDRMIRR